MINILIVLILYMVVFMWSELSYRKFHVSFLFSRKIAHIAGSMVSFFLPYFMSNINAVGIGIFFALVIFISKKKYVFKGIHDKKGLGIGEVVFPLGMALAALFVWPLSTVAYQGSCLVLGLSDGLAGYMGNIYGKRTYCVLGGKKTIEGSIIFFLFTLIIFISYYLLYGGSFSSFGIIMLFIYASVITFVEATLSCGWDNLIIPITAGLALVMIVS